MTYSDSNRDGSHRFLAGRFVCVRMKDGSQRMGKVNEYDEDGAQVNVRLDGCNLVFPVERLSHPTFRRRDGSYAGA